MTLTGKPAPHAVLGNLLSFVFLVVFSTGCAVPLSEKTCTSLQGVSTSVMNDRQGGLSKEDAVAKLTLFTSGKPDSKPFYEVASKIIDAAYQEPIGTSDAEKAEITKSFVSRMADKCSSGELSPSYNPVIRAAPVIH